MELNDDENVKDSTFDYFLIYGLRNDLLEGNHTLSELKNYKPELLSMFPNGDKEILGLIDSE
jgi:hypothetical protein